MGYISLFKWFQAVLIFLICDVSEAGSDYDDYYWSELIKKAKQDDNNIPLTVVDLGVPWKPTVNLKLEIRTRQFMSFMSNRVIRSIVMGTRPILLSTIPPSEFVQN